MQTTSCPRCGADFDPGGAFCSTCGLARAPIAEENEAPPPPRTDPVLELLRHLTLGEYDIGGRLGMGGMASVYLAHELRLNRRVAIKAMLPELIQKADMVARFFDEARKQARLEHRNIVPIYSLKWSPELPFFVMKFVDGFSIDDIFLARGALPIPVVQHVLHGAIAGLQYAHDEGVVHRDVKPGNILIDRRGEPIVSDFGIAKAAESPNLTMPDSAIGTPAYMSPEQCRAMPVTAASDQYSLGIVAYQLLAGSTPFSGSALDLLLAQTTMPPPPLLERRPDCPPRLAAAIMRMLEKPAADRWPTLRDAVPDLLDGMGDEAESRRQLVACFPDRATAAELLPLVPVSPVPAAPRPPRTARPLVSLIVTPANGRWELEVGETARMRVRRSGDAGVEHTPPNIAWSSTDVAVATVTGEGLVTGRAPGRVSIIADEGGSKGRCDLTIAAGEVAPIPAATAPIVPRTEVVGAAEPAMPIHDAEGGVHLPHTVGVRTSQLTAMMRSRVVRATVGVGTVVAITAVIFMMPRKNDTPVSSVPTAGIRRDSVAGPLGATGSTTAVRPESLGRTAGPTGPTGATGTTGRAGTTGATTAPAPKARETTAVRPPRASATGSKTTTVGPGRQNLTTGTANSGAPAPTSVNAPAPPTPHANAITALEGANAIKAVLASVSAERWRDVDNIVQRDLLGYFKDRVALRAALHADPRIINSAGDTATVEFDAAMTWTNLAGYSRKGQAALRAKLARSAGSWHVTEMSAREKLP